MQFVSWGFLLFLIATIAVYYIVPKKVRYIWLLAASLGFYYLVSGKLLIFLLLVTVITYVAGLLMGKNRKVVLISAVVLDVLLLGYFKYAGFILDIVNDIRGVADADRVALGIIVPVGISFYIFQSIGYIADCYKEKISPEKNYLKVALFISFFATVTSGPIERAGNMLPQYSDPKDFSYDRMRDGLLMMLWGFFQKIVIADRLAIMVNTVYSSYEEYKGTVLFLTAIFYTMEIYCDFAGYSNIAIGAAKIMGIDIMQNFKQPYLADSVAAFWRKWHISLSSWLKDYIYIPLGGNRKGYVRKLINICIVFAISGLWHGAAWTFVVWGLLHGLYQVLGIVLKTVRDALVKACKIDRESFSHKLIKIAVTFMLVNIGWIFFRAPDFNCALYFIKNMWTLTPAVLFDGTLFGLGLVAADVRLMLISIAVLIVVDILNEKGILVRDVITKQSLWLRWVIYIAAVVFVVTCGVWGPGYDAASFIYQNF
ncbi:MAG: MBOAT family protein [Butyrivibrio sp.]|nr:MBOAT family protein [Butyrivibrio sp.]